MKRGYQRLVLVLVIALFGMLNAPAWAQSSGRVSGTIADQSGAIVPSARLTLTNLATNVVLNTTSNEVGLYVFPSVNPGRYRLTATVSGMQTFEATLTVQVAQTATVNPVLQVQRTETQVTVQDVTPLVTSDAPTLGSVLERSRVEQLPLNGRSLSSLTGFIPGVYGGEYGRAYGFRGAGNETLIDGVPTTDHRHARWGAFIGLDAVNEFKIETNNSSAKYARPLSMIVSIRSGTNDLHGSVFETHRNSAIGTARRRQDIWEKAPFLNRAEYGASMGGPVVLPKLYDGRNKTFWFFAWEGMRQEQPSTTKVSVPTMAMRQGDFSNLRDAQGRAITIYDPWTTNTQTWQRQPFSYGGRLNAIDPARLSPVMKYMFSLTPAPTLPDVNPLVEPNLYILAPNSSKRYSTTTRIDHNFSDNDRFYFTLNKGVASTLNPPGSVDSILFGGLLKDPNTGLQFPREPNLSVALSYTHLFSPTFFNEFFIGGSNQLSEIPYGEIGNWTEQLGLPNPFGKPIFPALDQMGLSRYGMSGGNNWIDRQGLITINDNATKLAGKHEIQFGFHARFEQTTNTGNQAGTAGSHSFNTNATALYNPSTPVNNPQATPQTGFDLANAYIGVANYLTSFRPGTFYPRYREYALYLQDNIKVTPRLTLNLGLRWEYYSNWRDKSRMHGSFSPDQKAGVLAGTIDDLYRNNYSIPSIVERFQSQGVRWISAADAGLPVWMMNSNPLNFGPRLGLAYRISDGARAAVLRGGYRMSYAGHLNNYFNKEWLNSAPLTAQFQNNVTSATQSPDGIAQYGMRSVPTIIAGVNSQNAIRLDNPQGLSRGSAQFRYYNQNQPNMKLQDWNLTLEKEVFANTVARAGYIGNHGSNLPQWYSYNDPTPNYVWFMTKGEKLPTGEYSNVARRPFDQTALGNLVEMRRTGYSNYSGVQLELERRYDKGFGFHIYYNIQNAIAVGDDMSQPGAASAPTVPEMNMFLPSLGVPADYDKRNRLLNYMRDINIPHHDIAWNWLVDLPAGRGKWLGRNAGGVLDKIIGGWQIAGTGGLNTRYFLLPTTLYPTGEKIEMYGYKYPIQDCRSGRCQPGYLWWNGYIPPHQINSVDANGNPNGIMGVPADYKPAGQPLIPFPQNPNPNDPLKAFYGTNTTWVTLKDGSVQQTTYDPGMHEWQNQAMPGLRNWGLNASLFKRVAITERVSARFNMDFFNVLNHAGNPNSIAATGVADTSTSGAARIMQLTLRIMW